MPFTAPFERLVIATHNKGKLREFADLLRPHVREIVSAGDLGLTAPEETGATFEDNALLKAQAAALASGALALADDSGLCVTALSGRPGIYSARWAVPDAAAGMARLQRELGDAADRSAYFVCVLALCEPTGRCLTVEGRINGVISPVLRGARGHGYDPIFIPSGWTKSFAEMTDDEKNAISHRGLAMQAMIKKCFTPFEPLPEKI